MKPIHFFSDVISNFNNCIHIVLIDIVFSKRRFVQNYLFNIFIQKIENIGIFNLVRDIFTVKKTLHNSSLNDQTNDSVDIPVTRTEILVFLVGF